MTSTELERLRVTIVRPQEVGDLGTAGGWEFAGAALAPHRLRSAARDRRWQTWWVLAELDGAIVGVVPVYQVSAAAASEQIYDPRVVAGSIAGDAPDDAREWLYVGGFRDLIAGSTVSSALAPDEREEVRRRLVTEAFAYGRGKGLYPFAIYVRDEEIDAFDVVVAGGGRSAQVRETAVLELPGPGFSDYVQGLSKRDRYRVRRELLELAEVNLGAAVEDVADLIAEAAPLVLSTKQRYGVADHPVMVALRLREWTAGGADHCGGFALRDEHGVLRGVSFAAVHGATAELYELGLAEDVSHRLHAYAELLVYAPVRFALRHGCTKLVLGMDSIEPKARRGARVEPVWAVTG